MAVISKPLKDMHLDFVDIVDKAKKEVSYQANTGLVEERLNEEFGVVGKIKIRNILKPRPRIIIGEHNVDEYRINIGRHRNPNYLYRISEHTAYDALDVDFEVIINNAFGITLTDDDIAKIVVLSLRFSANKSLRIRHEDGTVRYTFW